jgi:hypothetical protein
LTETLTMLDKIEVLQKKGKPKKVDWIRKKALTVIHGQSLFTDKISPDFHQRTKFHPNSYFSEFWLQKY